MERLKQLTNSKFSTEKKFFTQKVGVQRWLVPLAFKIRFDRSADEAITANFP